MPFNGLALYGQNSFQSVEEDVSMEVSLVSPAESALLNLLSQPPRPATNILHEWLEDSLAPSRVTNSSAIASTTADTAIGVGSDAARMRVGQIIELVTGEYVRVSAISGNTITVERQFGGTSATSVASGTTMDIIADAALEGDDVGEDVSVGRARKTNYVQIFKKDVIVSGSQQAVSLLGGISDEFTHQRTLRLAEAIRDLDKAVIKSILSLNTIGSGTAVRTMKGLRSFLSTNVHSIATLTDSLIGDVVESAWNNGGSDLDIMVVDSTHKRTIDTLQASRVQVGNVEDLFRNVVTSYEGTYGRQSVVLDRWMPTSSMFVISSNRVRVVPLQNRTFRFEETSKTGDSRKGFLVGEYTLEVRNEDAMARSHG